MISKPTVLVLGAGASVHCQYPLGSELISRLCNLRSSPELDNLPEGWTREAAEAFLVRLSRSGHYSIDAFLGQTNKDVPLGKFLLAREMKKLEDIDRLFPPHDSGWYQYLFNALLVDNKPQFEKNHLNIITFNYDRSLEAYLHVALQNRFDLSEYDAEQILKQISIIHVHGILGNYPQVSYSPQCPPAELVALSSKIQIIHEIQDHEGDFCNDMFRQANKLLQDAERIYFLGFGFHTDNVRRFKFFRGENIQNKTIRSTLTPMGSLEKKELMSRLAVYGFSEQLFPHFSFCSDFFQTIANLE
jgi:hypothetical protein